MRILILPVVACLLAACGDETRGITVPALMPVPEAPGAYFDQGVSSWHYVEVRPRTLYRTERPISVDRLPNWSPPARATDCPKSVSKSVCADWKKHRRP